MTNAVLAQSVLGSLNVQKDFPRPRVEGHLLHGHLHPHVEVGEMLDARLQVSRRLGANQKLDALPSTARGCLQAAQRRNGV